MPALPTKMIMHRRKSFTVIALLVGFAMVQVYVQFSFAEPTSQTTATFPPQQLVARLTTKGNLQILVNRISVSSGASVTSESILETPANVDATVDLGTLGSLDIEQQTNIKLEYDGNCESGNFSITQGPALPKCSARVTVYSGCVTAHYKQGAYMEAVTPQQTLLAESDKSRQTAGTFKICSGTPAGAAALPAGGLGTLAKVAIAASIIGGGVGLWPIINNPSSSTP
jgi:hypothetical protein